MFACAAHKTAAGHQAGYLSCGLSCGHSEGSRLRLGDHTTNNPRGRGGARPNRVGDSEGKGRALLWSWHSAPTRLNRRARTAICCLVEAGAAQVRGLWCEIDCRARGKRRQPTTPPTVYQELERANKWAISNTASAHCIVTTPKFRRERVVASDLPFSGTAMVREARMVRIS